MEAVAESIKAHYDYFINICNKGIEQVAKASELFQSKNQIDIDIYSNIVEYNFLTIFLSWESFLENVFVLYLCGMPGLNGLSVNSYVVNIDRGRAYKMLKGIKEFPDWTNTDFIATMAKTYFVNENPFAFLAGETVLIHNKKVRNRISHVSEKCKREFENIVLNYTGMPSTTGSVSDFLLTYCEEFKSTYFLYFINKLKKYAELLCNP